MSQAQHTLIIGGGLAGTTLALTLMDRGEKVTLLTSTEKNTATRVAAGVYNPIVVKRLTLSHRGTECTQQAHLFYEKWSHKLKTHFHFQHSMVRVFASAGEANDFLALSHDDRFRPHIQNYEGDVPSVLHAPFGCGEIKTAGRVDTELYLDMAHLFLQQQDAYLEGEWHEALFEIHPHEIRYQDQVYDRAVFCTGHRAMLESLWSGLRLKPVSGQVLDIDIPGLTADHTWHVGVYATPLTGECFRVGSTYDHHDLSGQPAEKGKREITEKLTESITASLNIVAHRAGVRPAAHDRKPYLGVHPLHKRVFILNGLGSRGTLLAPFAASLMADHLCEGESIPSEWDVKRCFR